MNTLSLLCVSKCEPHTPRFFRHYRAVADLLGIPWVLACDRCEPPAAPAADTVILVEAKTTIEDVLAGVHAQCETDWVLRLDDDETLTSATLPWLVRFLRSDTTGMNAVAFPRANLWGDEATMLVEDHMWPDTQCRLIRRDAETRDRLHQGLPADRVSPGVILHHKFLVKSRQQREEIARLYETNGTGLGLGEHYVRYSLPEVAFGDSPKTAPAPDLAGNA
jgi:hypothetical protein